MTEHSRRLQPVAHWGDGSAGVITGQLLQRRLVPGRVPGQLHPPHPRRARFRDHRDALHRSRRVRRLRRVRRGVPRGRHHPRAELTAEQQSYRDINALWFDAPGRADYSCDPLPLTAPRWPGGRLRVAIVGSGPAAFYAADELLTQRGLDVAVDMFERLPSPAAWSASGSPPTTRTPRARATRSRPRCNAADCGCS